jgi:AcrR family transcriptional regulator
MGNETVVAPRRGRPRKIDQDKIVAAAVELGLDSFSMQTIAERLGVSPATLYTHVRGRDEVLDLVGAALRARLGTFESRATTWRGWLTDFAHLVREHLAPSVSSVLVDLGSPGMSDRVGVGEDGLALLIADGFTPTEAGYAVWLVFRVAVTAGTPDEPSFTGFVREAAPVLDRTPGGSADAAAVPATQAVHRALSGGGPHDSFAFDLEVVLDGIERRRPPRPSNARPRTPSNRSDRP